MRIEIDNSHKKHELVSVKIKIVDMDDNQVNISKYCFNEKGYIDFDLDNYRFMKNLEYKLTISLVQQGKQIIKKHYRFTYKNCDQYRLGLITFRTSNNTNEITKINQVSIDNYQKYNVSLNPIAMLHQEGDRNSLYCNGTVLLFRGNLAKIISYIYENNSLKGITKLIKITEEDLVYNIKLLIEKGSVIVYE